MMQLHQDIKKFEEKKIRVIVVCPDKFNSIKKFLGNKEFAFDLVADSYHFIADKYGQEVNLLKLGRMPSQIILDKDEKILFKHYAKSMSDIVANSVVLTSV